MSYSLVGEPIASELVMTWTRPSSIDQVNICTVEMKYLEHDYEENDIDHDGVSENKTKSGEYT